MALINEHISHLKSILANSSELSDDQSFSDPELYFILRTMRQFLLKQKVVAGKYISPFNYQTIPCFKLTSTVIEDCECYTADCYSLQSNCAIPNIISSDKGLIVEGVYAINTKKPTRLSPLSFDEYRLSQYSKTMKDVQGWFIPNTKLHVVGYDRLAAVKVRALFEDPYEVLTMGVNCGCNEDGGVICTDPYNAEFPLDGDLSRSLWSLSWDDILKIALKMNPDLANNARPPYGRLEKK